MPDQDSIDSARAAVDAERAAEQGWKDALRARDKAVRAAFTANPDLGATALGRAVGLGASTIRALTRHLKE